MEHKKELCELNRRTAEGGNSTPSSSKLKQPLDHLQCGDARDKVRNEVASFRIGKGERCRQVREIRRIRKSYGRDVGRIRRSWRRYVGCIGEGRGYERCSGVGREELCRRRRVVEDD